MRAVLPAGIQARTPNDHFIAGPYCRVAGSRVWRIGETSGCPIVSSWIVPTTRSDRDKEEVVRIVVGSPPNDHFASAPDRGVRSSGVR